MKRENQEKKMYFMVSNKPRSIAGGNMQNPTFASLMQKLKLSYVLTKTLKGFGTNMKNKFLLLLEKIASIH